MQFSLVPRIAIRAFQPSDGRAIRQFALLRHAGRGMTQRVRCKSCRPFVDIFRAGAEAPDRSASERTLFLIPWTIFLIARSNLRRRADPETSRLGSYSSFVQREAVDVENVPGARRSVSSSRASGCRRPTRTVAPCLRRFDAPPPRSRMRERFGGGILERAT